MTEENKTLTAGQLAANGTMVQCLQKLLQGKEYNHQVIAETVKSAVEGWWRDFSTSDGEIFHWNAADFREFITADRPSGCQTPIHEVEKILRGTVAWVAYCLLIGGEPGGDNNPYGRAGKPESEEGINTDNVSIDKPLMRSDDPPAGNSVSSAVRRLHRERPDLLERVEAGELSPHAAMIEAGFREKTITIPADPRKAARRLVKHFTREQFSSLVDEALNYYRK